ncbi:MAG: hypothetical protein KDB82_08290 [Planctomycetes bacterium]|nr:hypothetical protein [Planctomycetota bacterium]
MKYWLVALLAVACFCPDLAAQRHDEQARRITSKQEYKGYRITRPPGSSPGSDGGDGGADSGDGSGSDGGGHDGYSRGGESQDPTQRGAGAGPARPRGGGGGGGGSGGGLSMPGWLGSVLQAIVWIILIAGAAIALFFIIKALLGIKFKRKPKSDKSKRDKKKTSEAETTQAPEEEAPIQIDEQVFEDALQHALREYKEALARNDFAAATLLAYRIFWLRAGWEGCVQNEDVRTWRDALRMVRASETRREVRRLLPLVERVRYAEYKPDRGEFENWTRNLEGIPTQGVLR